MAERRMFAKTIIDSDQFLDMPLTTQALYFHLSMRADDDGFVNNPKKIIRMIGADEDSLKLLVAKKFLIPFESGLVVIRHWRVHNYIQKDRYKGTMYEEEQSLLTVDQNHVYNMDTRCIQDVSNVDTKRIQSGYGTDTQDKSKNTRAGAKNPTIAQFESMDTNCIHDVSKTDTQVRLGKDRLGKDRLGNCIGDTSASTPQSSPKPPRSKFTKPSLEEVAEYCRERQNDVDPQRFIDYYESNGWKVGRNPMKDWKATVRSWESRQGQSKSSRQSASKRYEEPAPDHYESTFDAQAWEDYANNFAPQDLLDEQEEMLRGG